MGDEGPGDKAGAVPGCRTVLRVPLERRLSPRVMRPATPAGTGTRQEVSAGAQGTQQHL